MDLSGVTAHRNLAYVEGGGDRQSLDLYLPDNPDGAALPLIIWIHGGGWQNGSKDGCPPLRAGYVGHGYAVASLNYRLSQDAPFPAQIQDCQTAIRWLRTHAKEYHLDPERFGVWGSSAGGHLAALVGTSGYDPALIKGEPSGASSRVQAVCDFFGPTDFHAFVTTPRYESHAKADAPEGLLLGGPVLDNPEKAARANPITYVTPDDPPFLIVHGDADPVVPINQSQLLLAALKKAGVRAELHIVEGGGHGRQGFNTTEVENQVRAFFDALLKPKQTVVN
jgi:acetyl esterase/lipase